LTAPLSGGAVVSVDESAEDAALPDLVDGDRVGCGLVDAGGGALVDALVGSVGVVVLEGDTDDRPRCVACREPIELDDPHDPESWIHCEDANDLGDHTAEA
jgi:hypothetical protein